MKQYAEEEIIKLLREAETTAEPVTAFCRRAGISEQTFYRWRTKYGGMDVSEAKRLKALEAENQKLEKDAGRGHVPRSSSHVRGTRTRDRGLTNEGLKELLAKKW